MISVRLPYPPSANTLFPSAGARRVKSKRYKAWIKEAGMELMLAPRARPAAPAFITIFARAPDKRVRDIDGIIKPILDLLVSHNILDGDSSAYVGGVSAEWRPDLDHVGVQVTIESWQ